VDQKPNLWNIKRERTQKEILQAARDLFSDRGFNDVSIDEIAEKALVGRSTIYNYFQNGKDEIYFTLGVNAFKQAKELMEKNILVENSGLEQFLGLCRFTFRTMDTMPLLFEIMHEYYTRVNKKNIPIEARFDDVASTYGTRARSLMSLILWSFMLSW
jgi:AcrR family transcriptional regulator